MDSDKHRAAWHNRAALDFIAQLRVVRNCVWESIMKAYAIIINETGEIYGNRIYLNRDLAIDVIKSYEYDLDMFNNVLDNGTKVARLQTLSVSAE